MSPPLVAAPAAPRLRLSLGVTGHREGNAAFAANRDGIAATLTTLFDHIEAAVAAEPRFPGQRTGVPTRLHSLLAAGFDQMAVGEGLARDWEIVVPLPFGRALNTAINAHPVDAGEARALLAGDGAVSAGTATRVATLDALKEQARLFELADRDDAIASAFVAMLDAPHDVAAAQAYSFAASARVALAAQVMIEQSDLIVGVWDGAGTSFIGGSGHTIALALDMGVPVLWVDARAPATWRILDTPEALAGIMADAGAAGVVGVAPVAAGHAPALTRLIHDALGATEGRKPGGHGGFAVGPAALDAARWRPRSAPFWHGYRRVEALFGGKGLRARFVRLGQRYQTPDAIATGSAASEMAAASSLPGQDADFVARIGTGVLRRFAWADGISARLSDVYRGGMILNFLFSALAIVGGIAYLPLTSSDQKWIFALFELALLVGILLITAVGGRRRWHGRWFETRRVAEYLRHAPILLLLGVARPAGRWPKGADTSWPEHYARHTLRDIGLPRVTLSAAYLRGALTGLLLPHVVGQRDYHRYKAERLARAHHNLDRLSELLFMLAVASVSVYLALKLGGTLHVLDKNDAASLSTLLTFFGVLLPTFGAGVAGIRYFGDFERFSAISEVTAEKLDAVAARLGVLLAAPDSALDYARVAELAHATDDIVIAEIESWQAVFGGKHITVPV